MTVKLPAPNAIWEWMILPLRRYADFTGRSGQREFWFYSLFLTLCYIAAIVIFVAILSLTSYGSEQVGYEALFSSGIIGLVFLVNFVPGLALTARRLHDMGLSGWLAPLSVVAVLIFSVLAWIVYMIIMALPGQKHANKYGPQVGDEDMDANVFS